MRKSGPVYPFRGRSDSADSVSDLRAMTGDHGPPSSFVKRRQFLFLNLKKKSSLQDEVVRGRNSISLPGSPAAQSTAVFYQQLDPPLPPQRPLR